MSRKKLVDLTTGEINEEINARADFRVEEILAERVPFRRQLSRIAVQTVITGESMTHQNHAASCDVNNIIRQFDRTGQLPPALRAPMYGDVSHLNRPFSDLALSSQGTLGDYATDILNAERQKVANPRSTIPPSTEVIPPPVTDN